MDKLMLEAAEKIMSKSPAKLLGGSGNGCGRNAFYQIEEDGSDSFFEFRMQLLHTLRSQKYKPNKETRSSKHSDSNNPHKNLNLKEKSETKLTSRCDDQDFLNQQSNSTSFPNLNEKHFSKVDSSDSLDGIETLMQNLQVDDSNTQGLSKLEKRKLLTSELLNNVSVLDVKELDDNSSNSSTGSCTKCKYKPKSSDEVNIMEQIGNQSAQDVIALKNCRRHKKKPTSVYLCPTCGISYILSDESMLAFAKCFDCDYWMPEDPEFQKSEKAKQETSDCKVS